MFRNDPMSIGRQLAALLLALACVLPLHAAEPVTDFLGVPGPIRFAGTDYVLAWSSRPSAELVKQEYVPAGQKVDRYDSMLIIDVRPGSGTPKQMAAAMVAQLESRKATDPLVNHDVIHKDAGDETILDFLMSAPDPSGVVVEWNAYRYMGTGKGPGTVTLAISRRAYGDAAARTFLTGLKNGRGADIEALAKLDIDGAGPPAR